MTKRHFIALAEQLGSSRPPDNCYERMRQWENDICAIARVCEAHNPRFDRATFMAACQSHGLIEAKLAAERA